jgi:rhodanese-related sulfurtransferase
MNDITCEELKTRLANSETPIIIDVREQHEFDEYNINAKLIPLGSLLDKLDELPEDKSIEIILHCRSGQRSGVAKELLKAKGYTNCRNLLGGMIQWQIVA